MVTATIFAGTGWSSGELGRVEDDGRVFRGWEEVGRVDDDGQVYRGARWSFDKVGFVDSEGRIYQGWGDEIGRVENDGRVYRGDRWSRQDEVGRVEGLSLHRGAAALLLLLA